MLLAVLRLDTLRAGRSARPLSVTTGSKSGINCSVNTFGCGSTSSVVGIVPMVSDGVDGSTGLADVVNSVALVVVMVVAVAVVVETDGVEISVPTKVVVEEDDEMVLLFERVCSPKPESDVDALFSSLDSESGNFGADCE